MEYYTKFDKKLAERLHNNFKWIARDENGCLWAYQEKPQFNEHYKTWVSNGRAEPIDMDIVGNVFEPIKWDDEEPTRIADIYCDQIVLGHDTISYKDQQGDIYYTIDVPHNDDDDNERNAPMKTFSDDEKIVAKHIDKKYKYITREENGELWLHTSKPMKKDCWFNADDDYCEIAVDDDVFQQIQWSDNEPVKIDDIYREHVFTEAEFKRLDFILEPYRDKIKSICKQSTMNGHEFLHFISDDPFFTFSMPFFDEGTKYKGMEVGRDYSLEELGLKQ